MGRSVLFNFTVKSRMNGCSGAFSFYWDTFH
jgi:hypothetical protein